MCGHHLIPDTRTNRGAYPKAASLKLVGDRFALLTRQRIALQRCAASDEE